MNFDEAMEFIATTYKFGSKLGLERIRNLLKHLGNPHEKLKYVHVAGTNGKGSTTSFIASVLMEANYKVGIYTSPFIHKFNERIQVNNELISNEDIARIISVIKEKVQLMHDLDEGCPTEFEIVTALGFQYFYEKKCDIVVLEVGLGGRLDSTNIIKDSEVSVITTIDYDHMDVLGNTIEEIAAEKAGIIKTNSCVILYPQRDEVIQVIQEVCRQKVSTLELLDEKEVEIVTYDSFSQIFNFRHFKNLKISMLSEFQTLNASLAIMAIEVLTERGFSITDKNIYDGLSKTKWIGRFEILKREPIFLVDAAHNKEGSRHLRLNLMKFFPDKKVIFIVGVSADKDYHAMIEQIAPLAKCFIATQANSPRAMEAAKLGEYLSTIHSEVYVEPVPRNAVFKSLELCTDAEIICSFGSLYYVGDVRVCFEI